MGYSRIRRSGSDPSHHLPIKRPSSSPTEPVSLSRSIFPKSHFPKSDSISCFRSQRSRHELANTQRSILEGAEDSKNQRVVLALYEALSCRDVGTVHQILAPDLEWWFHGPPTHQFMMRLLTGVATDQDSFQFVPLKIESLGSFVLVEGCDHNRSISWVHAWTVTDGIITQVREYFNTSLTVTRLGGASSTPSDISASSRRHCPSVWESSLSNRTGKSVPGLVLAI